ncbi:MAG: alpha-amylase [Deltaproteobacteria bacterium]|nr:alpha-amylase [Deltaproteobacteria bacterium]
MPSPPPPARAPRPLLRAAALLPLLTAALLTRCAPEPVDMTFNHGTFVEDWRDEVIYQVVVDRFADGDPNNNMNVDLRREASYHGGDWRGLLGKLDYLERLGVTALWISPVVRNVEEDAGFASYHGYWTQSFIDTNPHFGDLSELQLLVDACHRRGMKVILDVVTNHIGQLFYYDINRNGQPDIVFFGGGGPGAGSQNRDQASGLRRASEWDPEFDGRGVQAFTALGENGSAPIEWMEEPAINRTPPEPPAFRDPSWYQRKGRVTVWEDEGAATYSYRRQQEIEGDFPGGLKDLATHKPEVRQALTEVFAYWIQAAGFDGFRIDTLKHQEPEFFDVFAPAIREFARGLGKRNFFMFGEAFDGDDELLGSYTHGPGVDSVFYFSAYYQAVMGVFAQGGPTAALRALHDARRAPIARPELLEQTARRLCALECEGRAGAGAAAGRCGGGLEACVEGLRAEGVARYSDAPKPGGLTDAAGAPLASRQLLVHFIDNHDVPRFLYSATPPPRAGETAAEAAARREVGRRRLRSALAYLTLMDGVPCVYYGTEQDFEGGPDPSNREDMWRSGFSEEGETFRYLRALLALRKAHPALRRGEVVFRWWSEGGGAAEGAGEGAGVVAFERVSAEERALVVLNARDVGAGAPLGATRAADGVGMEVGFAPGSRLVDALNGGEGPFVVGADGRLVVTLPPRSARVLVLE